MSLTAAWSDKFTLIVPTYNRPVELARLLTYLERQQPRFEVLVLDSSTSEVQQTNRALVATLSGRFSYQRFDSEISPWEKFLRGAELATTVYCSLCADDDVVFPRSIEKLVDFLEAHRDYSVAHGWYFTFYDNGHIGVTASVYRGGSLDQDGPIERLYSLFKNYEAVTYGVYRTDIMRAVLHDVQGVDSMLGRELLGGTLSIVHGKVARLPTFYYGRSHAPSHPYTHWHPLDFLISSPDGFYRDYAAYRKIVLECMKSARVGGYTEDELTTIIDLIHFRYLADYARPKVMEYLIEQMLAKKTKPEIMQGLWSALARENESALARIMSGNWVIRRLRDRFFPNFRLHHLRRRISGRSQNKLIASTTMSGRAREYLFYHEFLGSIEQQPALAQEIESIVVALNHYD